MAQFIVRNIEESLKNRLQERAMLHGHSMEEEARLILRSALKAETSSQNVPLGTYLVSLFHGIELTEPIREIREEPHFVVFDE